MIASEVELAELGPLVIFKKKKKLWFFFIFVNSIAEKWHRTIVFIFLLFFLTGEIEFFPPHLLVCVCACVCV